MAGVELFRRYLLGLVTALIVARPLVLGEDPGILSRFTDTSNLLITLLWLIAATGWAIWHTLAGKGEWYVGIVEAGLFTAVVAVFLSISAASYKLPAMLIGWEWLVFFVALFVVRQLATSEGDQRRLLAALLAGVVALAAQALYQQGSQKVEEPPRDDAQQTLAARAVRNTGILYASPAANPLALGGLVHRMGIVDQARAAAEQRQQENSEFDAPYSAETRPPGSAIDARRARTTYVDPDTFAGLLVLCLPALAAASLLRWRHRAVDGTALYWLTAVSLAFVTAALWFTGSWGAMLGLLLTGVVAAVFGCRWLMQKKLLTAFLVALTLATGFLTWGMSVASTPAPKPSDMIRDRFEAWQTAGRIIEDHPWRGVGAGNFGRVSTEYLRADAHETVEQPHNLALELLATYGPLALLGVGMALGGYFFLAGRRLRQQAPAPVDERTEAEPTTHWEFYFGGMAGLLLGYFLREMSTSPDRVLDLAVPPADELMARGLVSGFRALLWFAAFALFERVPWTRRSRGLALTLGVGALVGTLCVSGGIGFPSLAQLLWVAVALGLNAVWTAPRKWLPSNWFLRALPIPILLGLTSAYAAYLHTPIVRSNTEAVSAMRAAHKALPARHAVSRALPGPSAAFEEHVVAPLRSGSKVENEQNARRHVQLARWYGELVNKDRNHPVRSVNHRIQAVYHAERAIELDPRGPDGYLVRYWLARRFARDFTGEKKKQNETAADTMRQLVSVDPQNPRWHYLLAQALFDAGDRDDAQAEANLARELHRVSNNANRQLSEWQQLQVEKWLRERPAN